jgi:hypothetical protein
VLPKTAASIKGDTNANWTNLKTVSGKGITSIGVSAFSGCTKLTSVSIPKVTSIGDSAFSGCTSLSVAYFDAASSIGNKAFANTGATTLLIRLPAKAPDLGTDIFSGVTAAKTVTVRVPNGATGYTTEVDGAWTTRFKGGNTNITVNMDVALQ